MSTVESLANAIGYCRLGVTNAVAERKGSKVMSSMRRVGSYGISGNLKPYSISTAVALVSTRNKRMRPCRSKEQGILHLSESRSRPGFRKNARKLMLRMFPSRLSRFPLYGKFVALVCGPLWFDRVISDQPVNHRSSKNH